MSILWTLIIWIKSAGLARKCVIQIFNRWKMNGLKSSFGLAEFRKNRKNIRKIRRWFLMSIFWALIMGQKNYKSEQFIWIFDKLELEIWRSELIVGPRILGKNRWKFSDKNISICKRLVLKLDRGLRL